MAGRAGARVRLRGPAALDPRRRPPPRPLTTPTPAGPPLSTPTAAGRPRARFDDLRTGRALAFDPPEQVLTARTPDEVPGVLAAVQAAVDAGAWAFGLLTYEAAPGLDPALTTRAPDPDGLPPAWFGITRAPRSVPVVTGSAVPRDHRSGPWRARLDAAGHARRVAAVHAAIAAGDTYQLNLTTQVDGPVSGDLDGLYADLALAQRGAHHALLDLGRHVVASASPELFFSLDDDRTLRMRPMKGTARRGRTRTEDDVAAARLRASAKERAENTMIVDLVRHDAARLAEVGSVRVETLCAVERYPTVLQLTSDVTARVRTGTGLPELMAALFPCGSVTGAPKASTMALIADLEDDPRGVYCGALGWLAPPGEPVRARFSVPIRTLVVDRSTGTGVYGAGGGITWDSDAAAEWAELRTKARVLDERPEPFALLETLAHDGAGPRHLDRHLARLADSATHLGFRLDLGAARAAVARATAGQAPARVRLVLSRDGALDVELGPLPPPDDGPVVLALDDEPVDADEVWPHHKTTRRAPYDRRRARHPDAGDVVLVNRDGELTETAIAALAVRLEGRWWTPPLGGGALPGVGRAIAIDAGELAERVLRPADLLRAEALATISSVRGWRPAVLSPAAREAIRTAAVTSSAPAATSSG